MTNRSTAGVTLMELLIAISLLSLLSVGVLMAMRVGINAMEKANNNLMANRRAAGAQRILEQQIAGMIVTLADCRVEPSAPPVRRPFFEGQPQAMRFVSSYSLQEASRGYPRIVEYAVVPNPEGHGRRLVVNELLYYGPRSTGALCLGPAPSGPGTLFRPIRTDPTSFVLADNLAVCRFAYQQRVDPPEMKTWVPVWVNDEFPLALRFEIEPLNPDPSRIPLLSMIIPVKVNRNPLFSYED